MVHGLAPARDLPGGRVEHPAADGVDVAGLFGEGDEVGWGQKSEGGVLPAHQCLHAENLPGAQVGDGLVVEAELSGGDGDGQVGFEGRAADHVVVHLGVEELVAGLAAAFGHVHGEVGLPEQFGGIAGRGASLGHADADVDNHAGSADDERRPQRVQDPLGDLDGDGAVVVFHDHDRELVAAQAGDQVVGADAVVEPGGQLDEKGVASFMTDGVVDIFEVVDVDEQQALLPGPCGCCSG